MNKSLVGLKITKVRWMTKAEIDSEGWYTGGMVLVLDDGSKIYASQDDEGNGAGALFGMGKDGEGFRV